MSNVFPRWIAPEQVELGDEVEVHHTRKAGVTMVLSGVVAIREDHGTARHMLTAERGRLFVWGPKRDTGYRVLLLKRKPAAQTPLFEYDLLTETRSRVA